MKNVEITSNINKYLSKGKKLLLVGCMSAMVLGGCSSTANDIGIINEGKEAENLSEKESQNLKIGTIVDKIPDAEVLDKEDKGYLAYYDVYIKSDAGEWEKDVIYSLTDGDVNIGYERHNESNTMRTKCTGYMIVPIKYEKTDGEWKKYGKDLSYTEIEVWVEIENKIRTDKELENAQ